MPNSTADVKNVSLTSVKAGKTVEVRSASADLDIIRDIHAAFQGNKNFPREILDLIDIPCPMIGLYAKGQHKKWGKVSDIHIKSLKTDPGYGIRCDDIAVIDTDKFGPNHANDSLQWFERAKQVFDIPETLTVKTPSGGYHYYFKITPELRDFLTSDKTYKSKNKKTVAWCTVGLDLQATKKRLIVGPGSKFENGTYEVINPVKLSQLPDFPSGLIEWKRIYSQLSETMKTETLVTKVTGSHIKNGEGYTSVKIGDGSRNDWLYNTVSASLRGSGFSGEDFKHALYLIDSLYCYPPYQDTDPENMENLAAHAQDSLALGDPENRPQLQVQAPDNSILIPPEEIHFDNFVQSEITSRLRALNETALEKSGKPLFFISEIGNEKYLHIHDGETYHRIKTFSPPKIGFLETLYRQNWPVLRYNAKGQLTSYKLTEDNHTSIRNLSHLWAVKVEKVFRIPVLIRDSSKCFLLSSKGINTAGKNYLLDTERDYFPKTWGEMPGESTFEFLDWNEQIIKDAQEAYKQVTDWICDFPFADSGLHRLRWFVALISNFIKISDNIPLFVFDASQRNSGKTKLAQIIQEITGSMGESFTYGGSHDEQERAKNILATLLNNPVTVIIDNVKGAVKSASFEALFTSEGKISGRTLGKTESRQYKNNATWILTANNVSFGQDMARRIFKLRLEPGPKQNERKTFKHNPILRKVRDSRHETITNILTILNAWITLGAHEEEINFESFEEWSNVVTGIITSLNLDKLEGVDYQKIIPDNEEKESVLDERESIFSALVADIWNQYGDQPLTSEQWFNVVQRNSEYFSQWNNSKYFPYEIRERRDHYFQVTGGTVQLKNIPGRLAKWTLSLV